MVGLPLASPSECWDKQAQHTWLRKDSVVPECICISLGAIDLAYCDILYRDLKKGLEGLVLESLLHLVYLTTPYDLAAQSEPDWMVYFRQVRKGTFQLRPLWTFVECLATASPRLKRWDWTFPLSRLLPLFIWTIAYQLCKTVALTTFVHTHTHVFGVLLNIYLCVYVCVQEVWMSVHSSGAIHLVFMDRSLTRTWGSPLSLG